MTDQIATARRVPAWVPVFNPLTKTLLGAGVPLGPNALLTVRGRRTGTPRTTPVAIIEAEGRRWIWAPWGEAQWVRNLRAAGRATVTVRGRPQEVRAIELDPAQRIAFFRDTLGPLARRMRFGVQFLRIVDQTDVDDPVAAADGRAVFELRPIP